MSEKPSPIQAAQTAREKIAHAVEKRNPLRLPLEPGIAACIFGLPKEIFERYGFSALITTDEAGIQILVADSEDLALQAFRNWQQDKNPIVQQKFNQTAYLALYRLISAIRTNQAESLIKKGVEGLILGIIKILYW